MNSYLLIEKSAKLQEEKARDFCQTLHIDPVDITIMRVKETADKKSSPEDASSKRKGIALIRELYKTLHLAPIRGDLKALIIHEADGLSIPAQNALLKTIEEPPKNTKIILTTENKNLLLPTILSRCLILNKSQEKQSEIRSEHSKPIPELIPQSISYALKRAENLSKDKQTALTVLEEEVGETRKMLAEAVSQRSDTQKVKLYAFLLSSQMDTYALIKSSNANLRLALEHYYLSACKAGNSIGT